MNGLESRLRAALVLCALSIASCDPGTRTLAWEIEFAEPALGARAIVVEGRILEGGCTSSSVRFAGEAERGESPPSPPSLAPGRYGFEGRARDADCVVFATGCVEREVPTDDGAIVVITLAATAESTACPPSECSAGRCDAVRDGGGMDADPRDASGPDARVDGATDDGATGDAASDDAGSDAGIDAPSCGSDGDCGECRACAGGSCVPADEGLACTGGSCRAGSCCGGCWNGTSCETGGAASACGDGGALCRACTGMTSFCSDAMCVPARAVATLAAASTSACAIAVDGALFCWGANDDGQVGIGTSGAGLDQLTPARVGTATDWRSLGAGGQHVCAIDALGAMDCWGYNSDGQLGLGDLTRRTTPTPISAGGPWSMVDGGLQGDSTCALAGTRISCVGQNDFGQLGLGDIVQRPVLTPVEGDWRAVSVGHRFACGIRTDGGLWCWGELLAGQLGIGVVEVGGWRDTPQRVGMEADWDLVVAGDQHACGIRGGGELFCWGSDSDGQLRDGMTTIRPAPQRVGTATWRAVALGNAHTCAVRTDGSLWCWGRNDIGQLGIGAAGADVRAPVRVGMDDDWVDVTSGDYFSCGVRTGGRAYCWGQNGRGQTGQADRVSTPMPRAVVLP